MATVERQHRFEALLTQYSRLIASVVRRVAGRAGDHLRADVEQRVLMALWRQVENEQTIEHPTSYIYRIAVREAVRAIRQEAGRREDSLDGAEEHLHSEAETPHDNAVRQEQRRQIEASVAELSPDRQRAVRAHLSGFDVQDIMDMYAWPYHKARNLIARGMADLRAALRRRGVHG